jgi:hypothetical protein
MREARASFFGARSGMQPFRLAHFISSPDPAVQAALEGAPPWRADADAAVVAGPEGR